MEPRGVSESSELADRSSADTAAIGKYRILAGLGEGGMANVYLAVARGPSGFSKLVVLKALRSSLVDQDDEFIKMFLDEARLAARLNHPHVVQTYEVGEEGGRFVIVMEYLDGQPLSRLRAAATPSGGIPLGMHLSIIADLLAGLHYAHELKGFSGEPLGLVHRDVSPQNVFITYDGQVKVLDFGIAKVATSSVETRTGQMKGKIQYMAPEQMSGDKVDRRADIFAAGVMLWEAVAGRRLWKGLPDVQIMHNVMSARIPPLKEAREGIDDDLVAVVEKAMAMEPADRFASAAEMETALNAVKARAHGARGNREIGRYVSSLFEEQRQKLATVIDEQMRRIDESGTGTFPIMSVVDSGSVSGSGGGQRTPHSAQRPSFDRAPATAVEATITSADAASPRGHRGLVIALVALLLAAGVAVVALRPREPAGRTATIAGGAALPAATAEETARPPPAPASPSATPPPPSADLIAVVVSATPESARLSLDGQPLDSNPAVVRRPRGDEKHTLRATAAGYLTKEASVSFAADGTVTIALEGATAPSRAPAPRAAPPRREHASPAPPSGDAPKKPSCDQPFYVDDRGIMTMRPECR